MFTARSMAKKPEHSWEKHNMHYPGHYFNHPQDAARKDVHGYWDDRYQPHEQRASPAVDFVLWMREFDHAFDLGSDEERRDADEGGPGEDLSG